MSSHTTQKNQQLIGTLKTSIDNLATKLDVLRVNSAHEKTDRTVITPSKEKKRDFKFSACSDLKKDFTKEIHLKSIYLNKDSKLHSQENFNLYNLKVDPQNYQEKYEQLAQTFSQQREELLKLIQEKEEQGKSYLYQLEKQKYKFDKKHNVLHNRLILLEK